MSNPSWVTRRSGQIRGSAGEVQRRVADERRFRQVAVPVGMLGRLPGIHGGEHQVVAAREELEDDGPFTPGPPPTRVVSRQHVDLPDEPLGKLPSGQTLRAAPKRPSRLFPSRSRKNWICSLSDGPGLVWVRTTLARDCQRGHDRGLVRGTSKVWRPRRSCIAASVGEHCRRKFHLRLRDVNTPQLRAEVRRMKACVCRPLRPVDPQQRCH